MPRYFLHIRSPDALVQDLEGEVHKDLLAARDEAISAARDIMSDDVR